MPDAFTKLSSLLSDQAAYERLAYFQLRPSLVWDNLFDVKPVAQSMPGSSVKFTQYAELAAATTPLTEDVDPDSVAMSDAQVTVTLNEYGNAIRSSAQIRAFSFLNIMQDAANLVGYNAALTVDTLARAALIAGTNVIYGGDATTRNTIGDAGTADRLSGVKITEAVAKMRARDAIPHPRAQIADYVGLIHPNSGYDLRVDTGATAWVSPAAYAGQWNLIQRGFIGTLAGAAWVETSRVAVVTNDNPANVYLNMVVGGQAGAKAYSVDEDYGTDPVFVMNDMQDKLRRFRAYGWKHIVGYGIFREAALQRIECDSALG